jgi:GDP-L-fucose synthase
MNMASEMTSLLAQSIAKIIGWEGTFTFNISKPHGTPCKVMDVSRLRSLDWSSKTDCESGIQQAYE